MSVHSIDHIDDRVSDPAYKGYEIDQSGEVTEFYDHRDEEIPASSYAASSYRQPLMAANGHTPAPSSNQPPMRVIKKDAGCCSCCVSLLTAIGTLPVGAALAAFFVWLGTGMFIGGGWKALNETLFLFERLGPISGNPATDPPPQYLPFRESYHYELRDLNNLGNRVPEVFDAIKYSFYGIAPFMLIFVIILLFDNHYVVKTVVHKSKNCKTSGAGLCITASLIGCCYVVMIAFIFWLCFTTLGIYYYRITMLRCYDLNDRKYSEGVKQSICIDLVQLGVIMYQNTNAEEFGKICGPRTPPNVNYGDLQQYCNMYQPAYAFMLLTFSGCFLVVLGMVNFIIIFSINYSNLTTRLSPPYTASPQTRSRPPTSVPAQSVSNFPRPQAYIRGIRDAHYPGSEVKARRSSKDIELDYIVDEESSVTLPRYRDLDSNVGVNYYYRDHRKY